MLEWDKLKTFYHVAKIGSFTKTGEHLHISQSAISRQIINIEERLGIVLFRRMRKGLVLTKEGQTLFDQVEKMYQHADHAEKFLKGQEADPTGELSIYTTNTLASWFINFMPEFLEQYPDIRLNIRADNQVNKPRDEDVIIGGFQSTRKDLEQTRLYTIRYGLFASQEYLDKFGIPKSVKDLDKHRLLAIPHKSGHLWDTDAPLKMGKKGDPRSAYLKVDSSSHLALKAAHAGMGIIYVGEHYPQSEGIDLVRILKDIEFPGHDVYLIHPKDKGRYKTVQVFKEYLLNRDLTPPPLYKNKNVILEK